MQKVNKKYGLWEYFSEQHDLNLLGSDIHEIIELSRKEMELPTEEDIETEIFNREVAWKDDEMWEDKADWSEKEEQIFTLGANWALDKVRNPYPQSIRFKKDPDEFFNK